MKRIISIRPKSSERREEFVRGSEGTVQHKIINIIQKDPYGEYDFLIDDNGSKYIKSSFDLSGEVINIIDDNYIANFDKDEDGNLFISINDYDDIIEEGALPQESTVNQLKRIRKISKGTDIGDKISDMNKQGANIQYINNPIDTGVESIQKFWKKNKNFQPGWNLKNLTPYKEYPIPTTIRKKKRKKT